MEKKPSVTWAWYGLLILCLLDMVSSAIWLHMGLMTESNPILELCYTKGLWLFLCAKTATFLPALLVVRAYYAKYTRTIKSLLCAAFWFYLGGWCLGTLMPFLQAA